MRRLLFPLAIGLGGIAILIGLGTWQVQRLGWKQDLLAGIEAEISAAPVPLSQDISGQRYAPVTVTGQFAEGHIRMLASRRQVGAVYRVIRPFDADGVGSILIDTGWQPDSSTVAATPSGTVTLTGNIDMPNEADGFTPAPDLAANIWFARDVPAMADALGTDPLLVVLRDAPEVDLGVTPWPVDTAGIPNDHLQYAITWFSLALIWAGMTLLFIRRSRDRKD